MSTHTVRCLVALIFAALLLAPCGVPSAQADDDDGPDAKAQSEAIVTRLFDVGALTGGRPDFYRELSVSVEPGIEEELPLFGGEAEEPFYPVGQVDELIEMLLRHVRPDTWESTLGASIRANGEQMLVVRSFADVMDDVATYLDTLQQQMTRRVCVDVESFRLTSTELRDLLGAEGSILADSAKLEALRGGERAGPSVSVTAYQQHRAAVFSGTQRAFVGDYDVEVAWGSKIADPIVWVDNAGLSADVHAVLGPEGATALVTVGASLSQLISLEALDIGEGRLVELPQNTIAHVQSRVEIPIGRWALLEGQSSDASKDAWVFALRVTALPQEELADGARGIPLSVPTARPSRSFELRSFDIALLGSLAYSRMGESPFLTPSNFTPPEPPELPEPMPIFPGEAVVELIRVSVVPGSWELRGAFLEARNGYLHARNAPDVLDAIATQLKTLRRELLWSIVTTAEVVDVPEALGRRLQGAPDRVLDRAGSEALEAAVAAKEARRLGVTRVAAMRGSRNAVTTGRRIAYIGDYEVEIAQESAMANPVVERCLSGSGLDVQPHLTAHGQTAETVLRYARSEVRMPLRKVDTPHGEVTVPEMDIFRLRAALQVPLGKTMIVGSAGDGGRRRLLLVTTQLRRTAP